MSALALSVGKAISAGPCVRSTAPPAGGDFALISGHEERQVRLALAAQDVEVDVDPGARW
jgi:hypothetical protein